MGEKKKKIISAAMAAGIAISTVLYHDGKELHIPVEYLPEIQNYRGTYSTVASGGYSDPSTGLPENITDLGASPINPDERLFGFKFDDF